MRRLLPLLLLGACVDVRYENPEIPKFNIFAVMISGRDTQLIFFDRVYQPTQEHGYGLEGAWMYVEARDTFHEFQFGYLRDTVWYYFSVFNVYPKDTLRLNLVYEGDTFTATTILTGDFQIVFPKDEDTIVISSDAPYMVWTHSEGAYLYKVKAVPLDTTLDNLFYFSMDTLSDVFTKASLFPVDGWYDVYVMAYNPEILTYYNSGLSNIEGAYGVFGGVVERKIRIYVRIPSK